VPRLLSLDGRGSVYWTAVGASGDDVKTAPIRPGAKRTLASNQSNVSGIAGDGETVFWLTFDDGIVWSLNLAGSARPAQLATRQTTARCLVSDEKRLFWTDSNDGRVAQMSKAGGTVTNLVTYMGDNPVALTVNATTVYWTGSNGMIGKVPIGGGVATAEVPSVVLTGASLAVDPIGVYWIQDFGGESKLVRADFGLTRMVTLARGFDATSGLVVDDEHVYWGSTAGVMRLQKPAR
jgi:hypothetical protein